MSDRSQQGTDGARPSVRAQLLATEHWSLLATRSTAQSELLGRITTFLMLVSASIVGLALIGQATRFGGRFLTFALVLLGVVVMIGILTQLRAVNASNEDLAQVIGNCWSWRRSGTTACRSLALGLVMHSAPAASH
jgi:lipopolysaccharide export LptBFGC system permease protein LptF